jgi:hypothetical protein
MSVGSTSPVCACSAVCMCAAAPYCFFLATAVVEMFISLTRRGRRSCSGLNLPPIATPIVADHATRLNRGSFHQRAVDVSFVRTWTLATTPALPGIPVCVLAAARLGAAYVLAGVGGLIDLSIGGRNERDERNGQHKSNHVALALRE